MSFIDTIALPLFIFFIGVVALVLIGGFVYRVVAEARMRVLEQKRQLTLASQPEELLSDILEACRDDVILAEAMPNELYARLTQYNRRGLPR